MLALEFSFPAGRYHANPWGRNVNEGEAEWPPSPYRLARTLIDIQKRRFPDWSQSRIEAVLVAISGKPFYTLPPATTAHIRSFMSSNQKDASKKQKIFDSFVALGREEILYIAFDHKLDAQTRSDLTALVAEINYLGRSESWVSVGLKDLPEVAEWDCLPSDVAPEDPQYEIEKLACVLPKGDYQALPVSERVSWFDALCLSTQDLLKQGWSTPPALAWVDYARKRSKLNQSSLEETRARTQRDYRHIKYAVHSKVRPHVRETILFAERVRAKLMGIHRKTQGDDPEKVSAKFSGKNLDGLPLENHKHAFFLPLDEDNDGRIDHLLITADEPFDSTELMALDRLRSIWQPHGKPDASLILTSVQKNARPKHAKTWISVTPFVTARHFRKGRGTYWGWLTGEIKRECRFHFLPQPQEVNWIQWTMNGPQPIRWMEFTRGKREERPFRGHGCILRFDSPVPGPFALGARGHFGLGLFQPLE
ncbi:type I-G CRISPR-associated protein Csb2 [Desulfohalobium retbaense]|uniref:CRISPR-associated protein, GSU0054 n=1 Tax=Desulfohalobium retbaense (strain ATCC 49708 / DSM 5692 / JCM 16813 / HR100) TaxID=485915 RepID=C8X3B2_DESRD|nr:type I-U CRISPR-associated protein Csb2 [Desulfohalobium retbaense]ACV68909.1 conserved hypothetical protein [Desulfohalobium retbaense DSM 5692]